MHVPSEGRAPIKQWEAFPGRNDFCCGGRLIISRSRNVFYLTIGLITVTSGVYFAFDGVYLWEKVHPILPIIGALQCLFVFACLFRTAFSDPGIIPRASAQEAEHIEQQMRSQADSSNPYPIAPRIREVEVNGTTVKLKYCATCKLFRPPRSSHCSVCDNCVERFDHHCPWVGNCVGRRNYRSFYMFVSSLSVYCLYILATSVLHIVLVSRDSSGFVGALKVTPLSILVVLIAFFSMWSVVGLACFHSWLIVREQTTNEDIKSAYPTMSENPYAYSNICANCCSVLCSPMPPSLLNSTGFYVPVNSQPDGDIHMVSRQPQIYSQNVQFSDISAASVEVEQANNNRSIV